MLIGATNLLATNVRSRNVKISEMFAPLHYSVWIEKFKLPLEAML